ncbi:MAG: HDOD domain-containing protein [Proteobacteria bacterium]|nr:HDOD domain-containing protein [Pseudomonadota bacterium]
MTPELTTQLEACKTLPSPPGVATNHEVEKIGVDHACVGGWLLKRWNFPERIEQAVAASHDPGAIPSAHEHGLFARGVALTSLIAELFLDETGDSGIRILAEAVEEHLGLDKQKLGELLEEINALIPEAEALFETQILADGGADRIRVSTTPSGAR